ncbi:MAG TPA: A/G-specific adenine glycosylase [Planctomycetaceae bacterium]|nr:A/G-specific adenine glycosylase [Planctomycetaceae bacterium]
MGTIKPPREFQRRLIAWYAKHRREMPWRGSRDPYAIWVSEIMLQQTTTQTVRGYFDRFMGRFPTIAALAEAELDDVNRSWEGLGYYRRAAQLHRAARVIVEQYGGVFPKDYREVLALPGIGRYTAGAVLSIAYDRRLPILEANTVRLHARLLAYSGDPVSKEGQSILWENAERILPDRGNIGAFNQALMELGSLVCTPRTPDCARCPVSGFCRTAEAGLQESIPFQKPKSPPEPRTVLAVIVRKKGGILLQQFGMGERWAGLWDFPQIDLTALGTESGFIPKPVECKSTPSARPHLRAVWLKYGATSSVAATFNNFSQPGKSDREPHRGSDRKSDRENDRKNDLFAAMEPAVQTGVLERLSASTGRRLQLGKRLGTHRHTVTRYRILRLVHEAVDTGPAAKKATPERQGWFAPEEIAALPLNSPARRMVEKFL